MEFPAIEDITTPWYCNLHLHAKEHLPFHDVSGPQWRDGLHFSNERKFMAVIS